MNDKLIKGLAKTFQDAGYKFIDTYSLVKREDNVYSFQFIEPKKLRKLTFLERIKRMF